jgi:hypothetical protein
MTRRITYNRYSPQPTMQGQPIPDHNLRVRLQAALAAGTGLFVVLMVGSTLVVRWITGTLDAQDALGILIGAFVVSLVFSAALVVKWSLNVAERQWKTDDRERARRWALEDEDRELARALAEQAGEEGQAGADLSFVHPLALDILNRHFSGQKTTRDACVGARLCTQAEWSLVNDVFKAAGMKRGYRLDPGDDLASAWAFWRGRVNVRGEDVLVRTGKSQWRIVEPGKGVQ